MVVARLIDARRLRLSYVNETVPSCVLTDFVWSNGPYVNNDVSVRTVVVPGFVPVRTLDTRRPASSLVKAVVIPVRRQHTGLVAVVGILHAPNSERRAPRS